MEDNNNRDKIRIYVAGALNADSPGYIRNIHRMVKHAEKIRRLGAAVHVPANDFLYGVICGDHDYDDYFDNNIEWLFVSDAVALTPGWEKSVGVGIEVRQARMRNIPVLETIEEVEEFLKTSEAVEVPEGKEIPIAARIKISIADIVGTLKDWFNGV